MLKIFDVILNSIFPKRCIACRKRLSEAEELLLCEECEDKLMREDGGCFEARGYVSYVASGFLYKGVIKRIVHDYKFRSRKVFARTMGELFYAKIREILDYQKPDVIISVPLGKKRERERGYNQSELLARVIYDKSGIAADFESLVRIKETKRQSSLYGNARLENMHGAFACKSRFDGKTVLLVDDIYTTGITMNECAGVLMACGAKKVIGASFAITKHAKAYTVIGYTKNKGRIISPI